MDGNGVKKQRSGQTVSAPEGQRPQWVADPVIGLRLRDTLTEWELPLWRKTTAIGRDPTCDISLDSAAVSSLHCQIERLDGGGCIVRDMGSKNGTVMDGHRSVFDLTAGTHFIVGNVPLVAFSASMQNIRSLLQRYLGFDERYQASVENALVAAGGRRHLFLVSPDGGQGAMAARIIHEAGPAARQPLIVLPSIPDIRAEQRTMLSRATHGTLVVGVDRLPRDRFLFSDALRSDAFNVQVIAMGANPARAVGADLVASPGGGCAMSAAVPPLRERSQSDRLRLISILSAEIGRRVGVSDFDPAFTSPLLVYDWPSNLDELEQAIERLLVIRQEGSQRKAAARLGIPWSSFARWMRKLSLKSRHR